MLICTALTFGVKATMSGREAFEVLDVIAKSAESLEHNYLRRMHKW